MADRPDHVICITRQGAMAWCGRKISVLEFAFKGIDHAAENGALQGRLLTCPECAAAVHAALAINDRCSTCETSFAPCRNPGKECVHWLRWKAQRDDNAALEAAFHRGKRRGYTDGYYAAEVAARPVIQNALDMLRTERYGSTDPDKRERTIERIERFIKAAPLFKAE